MVELALTCDVGSGVAATWLLRRAAITMLRRCWDGRLQSAGSGPFASADPKFLQPVNVSLTAVLCLSGLADVDVTRGSTSRSFPNLDASCINCH